MPELPDVEVYVEALRARAVGQTVQRVRVLSPFVVRSFDPPVEALVGRAVRSVHRLGKRIVLGVDDELCLVIHLMIAGRLRWLAPQARLPGKISQAALDFPSGTLALTEAGSRKRASLHVARGESGLTPHRPTGVEPLAADLAGFRTVLQRENHTLKRALTDPRLFSGIGNAYSDEILHAARLSPVKLTTRLTDDEIARLFRATQDTLRIWVDRLRREFNGRFPAAGEITAFRPDFAVHGRCGRRCRDCGHAVQRIRYAEHETNYCPHCQTGGRILADRSLSRLLQDDWPATVEELELPGE
jgi:formamidopyrimidine-DNA glycosylase